MFSHISDMLCILIQLDKAVKVLRHRNKIVLFYRHCDRVSGQSTSSSNQSDTVIQNVWGLLTFIDHKESNTFQCCFI